VSTFVSGFSIEHWRVDSFSVSLVVASKAEIEVAVAVFGLMVSTGEGVLSRVELGVFATLLAYLSCGWRSSSSSRLVSDRNS
jgi:hypothetical protein